MRATRRIAMGKRGSGASSTGPPKKKASRESIKDGDTAIQVPNDVKATFVVNPWLGKVLERFDAEWEAAPRHRGHFGALLSQ